MAKKFDNNKPDPLEHMNNNSTFKKDAKHIKTPFSKYTEPTKTIQIRQHLYRELKIIAVIRKESIVDIACEALSKYLDKQPELKGPIAKYISGNSDNNK